VKTVIHIWQGTYPREVRIDKINDSLKAKGYEVHVLCRQFPENQKRPDHEIIDGVHIHRLNRTVSSPFPWNPFWTVQLYSLCQKLKPDFILLRDIPLAPVAVPAKKRFGIPIILDMAEHYPEAMRSWDKYKKNPILKYLVHDLKVPDFVEKNAVQNSDGIFVVCEEQKLRLIQEYAYPSNRIEVLLNTPVQTQEIKPEKHAPEGKINFIYSGILCEDRALEYILEGFDLAYKKDKRLHLTLAGSGESEKKLLELKDHLNAKDAITFTGRYTPVEIEKLYNSSHFGIVSLRANRFTEHTVANKLFDYPSYGMPFIYTNLTPLNRIVNIMDCGISFTPHNSQSICDAFLKITTLDYNKLSTNGKNAISSKFNWKTDEEKLFSAVDSWI